MSEVQTQEHLTMRDYKDSSDVSFHSTKVVRQ